MILFAQEKRNMSVIRFFVFVFSVSFVIAFTWRVFITVGVPVPHYDFSTIFEATAWVFGIFLALRGFKRFLRSN